MKTITKEQLLLEHIAHLEIKQNIELQVLKTQVHSSIEILNPIFSLFFTDSNLNRKSNLVDSAVNITTQLLTQNTILGLFQKPIKNVVWNLLRRFIK